ncbi:MAG: MTAP family purine nucleoside phosphorylase [Methanolinea sp.]|nr:MTAP family purine nucleoside phosphorylase [Methanolinea sp.]
MLGIIGGTSLLFSRLPDLEQQVVHTPYGHCEVLAGEIALLLRHQHETPPHRINHRAHLSALALLGVDRLVLFGSAGSLRKEIPPGSLMIPTDYYSTGTVPSIHEHAIRHVLPGFSGDLNRKLASLVPEARFGGVYVQTRGPRLETVAEVRSFAGVGDIVGMTVASEATLAVELGISIAALCTVDNYAHGLGEVIPTYEHIVESAEQNKDRTGEILSRIVANLG